jgi:hypothetical protein
MGVRDVQPGAIRRQGAPRGVSLESQRAASGRRNPHRRDGNQGEAVADGNDNGNGWATFWRTVAIALATALCTGLGAWLLFDRDQPSRAEVGELFTRTAGEISKLRDDLGNVRDQQNTINGKLDVWLNTMAAGERRGGRP